MTKTKTIFVPLYDDLMFKKVFGTNENVRFTIDLLESLFNLIPGILKGSRIANSITLDKKTINSKHFVLDVIFETKDESKINFEMQAVFNKNAQIKNSLYVSGLFAHSPFRGDEYKDVKPVSQVNFVKDNALDNHGYAINKYLLINAIDVNDIYLKDMFQILVVDVDEDYELDYNVSERFNKWRKLIGAESLEEATKIAKEELY